LDINTVLSHTASAHPRKTKRADVGPCRGEAQSPRAAATFINNHSLLKLMVLSLLCFASRRLMHITVLSSRGCTRCTAQPAANLAGDCREGSEGPEELVRFVAVVVLSQQPIGPFEALVARRVVRRHFDQQWLLASPERRVIATSFR